MEESDDKSSSFARKRPPGRTATRAMLAVSVAGVLLLVVLSAVFLPTLLNPRPVLPVVEMDGTDGNVTVTRVFGPASLLDYRAELREGGFVVAALSPLADNSSSNHIRFHDVDGTGTLTKGDRFEIDSGVGATATLVLVYRGENVAVAEVAT